MTHTCHAIACSTTVPPSMFMCRKHWYMVPPLLRRSIWNNYRHGQETTWKITNAYADIAQEAIRAVAEREGREVTGEEEELMLYDHFRPETQDANEDT